MRCASARTRTQSQRSASSAPPSTSTSSTLKSAAMSSPARAASRSRRARVHVTARISSPLAAVLRALADKYPTVLRLRGHAVGRRQPARLRRIPPRVSRNHPLYVVTLARPELLERAPTWGAGHRNFTSLFSAALSRRWRSSSRPRARLPQRFEIRSWPRRGVPLLCGRDCACCSTAPARTEERLPPDRSNRGVSVPETLHALIALASTGFRRTSAACSRTCVLARLYSRRSRESVGPA